MAAAAPLLPGALTWRNAGAGAPASLGEIAAANGVLFGSAYDEDMLQPSPFTSLYLAQSRIFTSNNFLKFGSIRQTEGAADFTVADQLIDLARRNGIAVRGHNLIWNEWTPDWLRAVSATRVAYWMDRHIEETVGRYAGQLHSWDVVNEPFWIPHGNEGGWRSGVWYSALGKGYVARALKRVRAVDPSAKIVINETGPEWQRYWSGIEGAAMRHAMLRLIDDLQDAGVKLDAIGLQCHWMPDFEFSPQAFQGFLHELAARKLAIYVTELDISDAKMTGTTEERDEEVARRYELLVSTALKVPQVEVVQTWELTDRATWQKEPQFLGPGGRLPRPLPFDTELQPKPAYAALARALASPRV